MEFSFTPCDQCGQRSYVFVSLPFGEISYCGHHYAVNADALSPVARTVVDLRHLIPA